MTAQITREIGFDWLAFTVGAAAFGDRYHSSPQYLLDKLSIPGVFELRDSGFQGWQYSAKIAPGSFVAWGGQSGTAYVSISAEGLAWLAEVQGWDWKFTMRWVAALADDGEPLCAFRRLDLCVDDKADLIHYHDIARAVKRRDVRMHWRSVDAIRPLMVPDGQEPGWTVYFGSRQSENFMRVYDKRAEQFNKRFNSGQSTDNLPAHWVRFEVEVKADRADALARAWIAEWFSPDFILGYFRQLVDFTDPDDHHKRADRRAVVSWWRAFVHDAKATTVRIMAVCRDVYDVAVWLHTQVATSLALVFEVYGPDFIESLIDDGIERMTIDQKRMLAQVLHSASLGAV